MPHPYLEKPEALPERLANTGTEQSKGIRQGELNQFRAPRRLDSGRGHTPLTAGT